MCCCRLESFDKARKSSGTDEDILFIYKRERPTVFPREEETKVCVDGVSLWPALLLFVLTCEPHTLWVFVGTCRWGVLQQRICLLRGFGFTSGILWLAVDWQGQTHLSVCSSVFLLCGVLCNGNKFVVRLVVWILRSTFLWDYCHMYGFFLHRPQCDLFFSSRVPRQKPEIFYLWFHKKNSLFFWYYPDEPANVIV